MADKLIGTLLKYRWAVVAFYVLLATAAFASLPQLTFNFSFRQFFPPSDPEVQAYNRFTEEFEYDDAFVLLALTSKDLFTAEKIGVIDKFVGELDKIDGVLEVLSISNVKRAVWKDDRFFMEEVFPDSPPSRDQLEEGRRFLLDNEQTVGNIISYDGQTTVVIAELDPARNDSDKLRRPILEPIWNALDEIRHEFDSVHDSGIPTARSQYAGIIHENTIKQVPLASIVVVILLIVSFRHWAGVLLSSMVVTLALLLTMGLMSATGHAISVLSTLLPVILLITGVADAIHFHSRYYEEMLRGKGKTDAIREAIRHMSIACFITSFTTAIGFSVLMLTSIDILREYGMFVGIGVLSAYIITITLLPCLLAIFPAPPKHVIEGYFNRGAGRAIAWVRDQVRNNRKPWAAVCILLILVAAASSLNVRRSMRLFEDLPDDHHIIRATTFFEEKLGGVMPLEIVFEGSEKGAIKNPEILRTIDDVAQFLRSIPEIKKVNSPTDLFREINRVVHENDDSRYVLPDSKELAAQYRLLYSMSGNDPLDKLLTPDNRKARISARVEDVYTERANEITSKIRAYLDANLTDSIKAEISGTWAIAHKINLYVVDQIFFTFILAFAVIFVVLSMQFKSLRIALISMIPNSVPLLVVLGLMGINGISLKPSSAVTFSIAFGIAVDDTIHFLTRFLSEYPKDKNYEEAIDRALKGTGHAMTTTTIILISGFMVPLVFSEILSNRHFSLLAGSCVLIALFGDLFIMPLLLVWLRPKIKGFKAKGIDASQNFE